MGPRGRRALGRYILSASPAVTTKHIPTVDESELLTRLRLGDDEAFATIFRAHYAGLVLATSRLLGERGTAEEIVQEVMLELWRRRTELVLSGPLRAYLYQATRNRALNNLRHARTTRRGEPFVRPPTGPPSADARALGDELRDAVRQAVSNLSSPQREVFEMSRADGLTYAEIARVLQISVKTVEARMGRALRQLREQLAPWLSDARDHAP
jgi:RNA polymerase sigma-70 factor (ECF subfamily)